MTFLISEKKKIFARIRLSHESLHRYFEPSKKKT